VQGPAQQRFKRARLLPPRLAVPRLAARRGRIRRSRKEAAPLVVVEVPSEERRVQRDGGQASRGRALNGGAGVDRRPTVPLESLRRRHTVWPPHQEELPHRPQGVPLRSGVLFHVRAPLVVGQQRAGVAAEIHPQHAFAPRPRPGMREVIGFQRRTARAGQGRDGPRHVVHRGRVEFPIEIRCRACLDASLIKAAMMSDRFERPRARIAGDQPRPVDPSREPPGGRRSDESLGDALRPGISERKRADPRRHVGGFAHRRAVSVLRRREAHREARDENETSSAATRRRAAGARGSRGRSPRAGSRRAAPS